MFFNNNRIKLLEESITYLDKLIDDLRERVYLLENAPYGVKKDGTPKAKPGRKAKS